MSFIMFNLYELSINYTLKVRMDIYGRNMHFRQNCNQLLYNVKIDTPNANYFVKKTCVIF